MKKHRLSWLAFVATGLCSVFAADVSPLPVEVPTTDAHVRYVGRFDTTDTAGPRCQWSASALVLRLNGGSLNVKMKDSGKNLWQVLVDGTPTTVLQMQKEPQWYPVATDLPDGEHTVELVKRTEASCGVSQILGFQVSKENSLLPATPATRKIEVIGDSISCGYGNESPDEKEHFLPAKENAATTYGALAARQLGADYVCVAWSGKKLWPNNSIVSLYDDVLPTEPAAAKWKVESWQPDVILINLGTNDFGKESPDKAGWVAAYVEFIGRLRKDNPKARIYCATGPMMNDSWPPKVKALTTVRDYISTAVAQVHTAGDQNVTTIDFAPQDKNKNGLGGDWHPSLKTHQEMADALVKALKSDLGW